MMRLMIVGDLISENSDLIFRLDFQLFGSYSNVTFVEG